MDAVTRPDAPSGELRWGSAPARRVLLTCVLGSSLAFLDATVVNVALPRIGTDLDTGLAGLQWVVNAYLVALGSLVLVGGSLGDRYGHRRMLLVGIGAFSTTSVLAGVAPDIGTLLVARTAQGIAAALLVPASLSLLTASIDPDDRARAVGAWSGLTGVAGALGPLLGGWLVDAASWRWVFFVNLPLAAVAVWTVRGVPEPRREAPTGPIDVPGALLVAAAVGLGTAGVISHDSGWAPAALVGALALGAVFAYNERRSAHPMLPGRVLASTQFLGANAVTLALYAGLGAATFLVVLELQRGLGYSALEAGAALLPVTALLLLLSSRFGAAAQRSGPARLMGPGPVVAAFGLAWLSQLEPGDRYLTGVLPGVVGLGLGLAITVAPLTAVVMASVDEGHLGTASGVNNAVARLASLLGVAVIPVVAGVDLAAPPGVRLPGYEAALVVAAVLCAAGGPVAVATVRRAVPVRAALPASMLEPCQDPCVREGAVTT